MVDTSTCLLTTYYVCLSTWPNSCHVNEEDPWGQNTPSVNVYSDMRQAKFPLQN